METLDPPETQDGSLPPQLPALETLESQPGSGVDPATLAPAEPEKLFAVGDLVWAKTKSRPWWPAEVSDPSLAPDDAKRPQGMAGSAALVAYFGNERAFAWCGRSQLKRFLGPNLHEMTQQSRSKSFIAAVEDALGLIAWCLESGLVCECIPADVRPAVPRGMREKLGIVNFSPLELLDCLRGVACDVSTVDMIECAKLKGWAVAFGRGWCGSLSGYHQRRHLEHLVDKIDLDVPAGELVENKEEEVDNEEEKKQVSSTATDDLKGRKKRSMAALMEKMDSEKVEVADSKALTMEENVDVRELTKMQRESGKQLEVETDGKTEDDSGSAKRERKKSKYLSPPYTDLSGRLIVSSPPTTNEAKTHKKGNGATLESVTDMPKIARCNSELVEDEDKKNPLVKFDSTSTVEIFSALLSTSRNLLHPKWKQSAKIVEEFFTVYRSSMFVNGTDYEVYKNHVCKTDKSTSEAGVRASVVGKSERKWKTKGKIDGEIPPGSGLAPGSPVLPEQAKAAWKKKQGKDGDDSQTPRKLMGQRKEGDKTDGENSSRLGLAPNLTALSEPVNVGKERNIGENGKIKETFVAFVIDSTNGSQRGKVGSKKKTKKAEANKTVDAHVETKPLPIDESSKDGTNPKTVVNSGNRPFDFLEFAKMEVLKGKEVANGANLVGLNQQFKDHPRGVKSQHKRRNSNHGDSGNKATDAAHESNPPRKRRKKTVEHYGNPAALLLSFSPDITLPSKEVLVSTFSKFGFLVDSETELSQDSRSARVVFAKSTDAEAAYNSSDEVGIFRPPFTTSRLHYLPPMKVRSSPSSVPVSKPPLSDIRKNLEKMISSLNCASPLKKAGSSDGLKPDMRNNLVGEMQGLLKKVDRMLNNGATSGSTPS